MSSIAMQTAVCVCVKRQCGVLALGMTWLLGPVAGLLPPSAVLASWPQDPKANLLIGGGSGDQIVAKIEVDGTGGCYVSWYDGGAGYDVRLQRMDAEGNILGPPGGVLIADLNLSWVQDYGLAVDDAGNALLAFLDDRSGTIQVSANLIRADGTLIWGQSGVQLTNVSEEVFLGRPRAAVTDEGHLLIGWSQDWSSYIQKLDASGATVWDEPVVLAGSEPENLHLSDLRAGPEGSMIALLIRESFPFYRHLYLQRLDSEGQSPWGEMPMPIFESGSIQAGNFPEVVVDGSGGAVIAWYEAANPLQCYVQHVLGDGTEAFQHNGVPTSIEANRQRVSPSAWWNPSTEEIFVFWLEEDMGQDSRGVYGQKIGSDGIRQWTEGGREIVPLGPFDYLDVSTLGYESGACVSFVESSGLGSDRLLAAVVDGSGEFVESPAIAVASDVPSGKTRLAAAPGANGSVLLVWTDSRSGDGDIYGDRFLPSTVSFRRGDANADGKTDLSDAVSTLNHLFLGSEAPPCSKAADTDDNSALEITDAIRLLGHLFLGGPPPEPPVVDCGADPTPDSLDCVSFPPCP